MSDKRDESPQFSGLSNMFDDIEKPQVKPQEQPPAAKKPVKGGKPREHLLRIQYDIPPRIKSEIEANGIKIGIPNSQLTAWLLSEALKQLDAGELDPTPLLSPSTSPKFRYNLIIE